MSLIFTASYWGDKFQVEVTHDGDLIFLDYNIVHDLAALEFGYPETSATKLLARWTDYPSKTIAETFELTGEQRRGLASDYSDHIVESTKRSERTGVHPEAAREINGFVELTQNHNQSRYGHAKNVGLVATL